jgi:four helix bundle protein
MATFQSFRDLKIWMLSHQLVLNVYKHLDQLPTKEKFVIASQLSRCVISVPANIAEGFGRKSNKEFIQYLHISLGSLEETRYFLILSKDLGYITTAEFDTLDNDIDQIKSKILSFIRVIKK